MAGSFPDAFPLFSLFAMHNNMRSRLSILILQKSKLSWRDLSWAPSWQVAMLGVKAHLPKHVLLSGYHPAFPEDVANGIRQSRWL